MICWDAFVDGWTMVKRTDALIEEIIAACDGDMHGALRALMLVNEQLECELAEWQELAGGSAEGRTGRLLH